MGPGTKVHPSSRSRLIGGCAGVDVGVLGERDLHERVVLLLAHDDADRRPLLG